MQDDERTYPSHLVQREKNYLPGNRIGGIMMLLKVNLFHSTISEEELNHQLLGEYVPYHQ